MNGMLLIFITGFICLFILNLIVLHFLTKFSYHNGVRDGAFNQLMPRVQNVMRQLDHDRAIRVISRLHQQQHELLIPDTNGNYIVNIPPKNRYIDVYIDGIWISECCYMKCSGYWQPWIHEIWHDTINLYHHPTAWRECLNPQRDLSLESNV